MPFLVPLIALVTGILIGDSLRLPGWGIIPIALATVYYLFLLKKMSTPLMALKNNRRHWVWIFLLFTGIGIFDMSFRNPPIPSKDFLNQYLLAEGEIIDSKSYSDGERFLVKVNRMVDSLATVNTFSNLQIFLYSEGFSADPGDLIIFPVRFTEITENPNFRPTGYPQRMGRMGINYKVKTKEEEIKIKGFNNSLTNSAISWRNRIISKIEKSSLSRQACNFIVALIFGDRSFLSEDVKNNFSNAGVAHVLALSGMHVSIIMGIILIILFPLKILGYHVLRYILALIIIWFYAFFTGMAPSTVRACIMTSFVLLALCLQRRNYSENALLASAFIILLITPQSLFDIGMQLSFLCVGSILLFAGPLNPINRNYHPLLHSFISAILVSLVATVTTWVVVSYYFGKIPLLFLPVNLCMLPFLPFYVWIAVLAIFLIFLGLNPSPLTWILNKGYDLFEWISSNLSAFGESSISINVQLPVIIFWLLGILIIAYALKRSSEKKKVIIVGGLSMMGVSVICIPFFNEKANDSIIFQKNFNDISLALYKGDEMQFATLPRNSVSRIFHKGCEVLSIDCSLDIDSIGSILSQSQRGRKRYLILGSGFRETSLKEIPEINNFDKIILHSSLKRKMETKLRQEAFDLGLKTIYSLREEGPLEELLPDSLPAIR